MKKGILIAIFILLLLSGFMGCHNGSRQAKIISRDSLIEILADLHISGSAIRLNQAGTTEQNAIRRNAYFDWVMQKHHITYQQFDTSFKYYLNETERFSKMYDLVINRIKEKQLENKRSPQEELIRKDSIRKDSIKKAALQKAAMKKDSIRLDSIKKVTLKMEAIQKAAFRKDSIKQAQLKKTAYKKESVINESLKKALKKSALKKDSIKEIPSKGKKIVKKQT